MYISFEKKFIYFRIPKTASTSLTNILEPYVRPNHQIFKSSHWFTNREINTQYHNKDDEKHINQPVAKRFIDNAGLHIENFYEFVFVRHPYNRLLSHYNYQHNVNIPEKNPLKFPPFNYSLDEYINLYADKIA